MEAAKSAINNFTSKVGNHDTTVHETVGKHVSNDTVDTHHHENVTTAVDREVHQDHHHVTVQPIHDKKTLPETHHHNHVPVEHRKFEHGNDDDVQRRLTEEHAKFKDTTTKGETKHTSSVQPTVGGERIHHHVHEHIQPVVHRQVIEPHVTHTTVPIHETHHAAAKHHTTSALPAVSMADFKKNGGTLHGRETSSQFYEGEPKGHEGHSPFSHGASHDFRKTGHTDKHIGEGVNDTTTGTGSHHTTGTHSGATGAAGAATGAAASLASSTHGSHNHNHNTTGTGSSTLGGNSTNGLTSDSHGHTGTTGTGSSSLTGHNSSGTNGGLTSSTHAHKHTGTTGNTATSGLASNGTTTGHNTSATNGLGSASVAGATERTGAGVSDTTGKHGHHDSTGAHHDTTTTQKPSLLARLNPLKDADGDGKKGFLD